MFIFKKKLEMPSAATALPGRKDPIPTATNHFVNGHPLKGPYPEGYETAIFGMGCFWGAERKFWELGDAVYVTAVGYAAGFTPNPTYQEVCTDATRRLLDRDEDGELDRHWGYPSYADSGAWLTNHQSGVDEGENWVYFVKIVTPSPLRGDYVSGGYWYTSDDIEIGPVIWGAFAKVQTVDSKLGITYESPYSTSFSDYPAY